MTFWNGLSVDDVSSRDQGKSTPYEIGKQFLIGYTDFFIV